MTPELCSLTRGTGSRTVRHRSGGRARSTSITRSLRRRPLLATPQLYLISDWSTAAGPNTVRFNSVITSVTVLQCVQSDVGVTLNAGNVSAWADQSGQAKNYSQGTGANQPALITSSNLSGLPVIRFDGSTDNLNSSLVLPAPGTTPTWVVLVARTLADPASGARFLAPNVSTNACLVLTGGTAPNFTVAQHNTSTVNITSPLLTLSWYRIEAYFTNSASDYVKMGPTTTTGGNAGNTSTATGRAIGKQPGEPGGLNFDIAMCIYCNALPTVAERAEIDKRIRNKYGSSVSV
jgi:hypothetical protein